jgi:hypothetical protein
MTTSDEGRPARPGTGSRQSPPDASSDELLAVAANPVATPPRAREVLRPGAISRRHHTPAHRAHPHRVGRTVDHRRADGTRCQPLRRNTRPQRRTRDRNQRRAVHGRRGEPAEISRIKAELLTLAASSEQSGSWLASTMEASWTMAEALLSYPQLADLLPNGTRSSATTGGTPPPPSSSAAASAGVVSILDRSTSLQPHCVTISPARAQRLPTCSRRPS